MSETAGSLTTSVTAFVEAMRALVPIVQRPSDWSPLERFVATDEFERVGTFAEKMEWAGYLEMLTRWATATDEFDTTVRRISEVPGLVYYEVEERHRRGPHVHLVNTLTVFGFTSAGEIRRLDVYMQQPG
jgi:hypothetical protein